MEGISYVYLNHFQLFSEQEKYRILCQKRNIHNPNYPSGIYPSLSLSSLSFEPVTIFAGSNGCGKNTLLRIIYQKRDEISFPASDDMFDKLLNERAINAGVHRRKEELVQEYLNAKYS